MSKLNRGWITVYCAAGIAFFATMMGTGFEAQAANREDKCAEAAAKIKVSSNPQATASYQYYISHRCVGLAAIGSNPIGDDVLPDQGLGIQSRPDILQNNVNDARAAQQAADTLQKNYLACRDNGALMRENCRAMGVQQKNDLSGLHNEIHNALVRLRDVENSCQKINSYESQAAAANSRMKAACESYQAVCQSTCENAEMAGFSLGAEQEIEVPKTALNQGMRYCGEIASVIQNQSTSLQSNANELRKTCAAAKRDVPTPAEPEVTKTQSTFANALPAMGQALAAMTPQEQYSALPTDMAQGYSSTSYSNGGTSPIPHVSQGNLPTKKFSEEIPNTGGMLRFPSDDEMKPRSKKEVASQPNNLNPLGQPGSSKAMNGKGKNPNAKADMNKEIYGPSFGGETRAKFSRGGYPDAPTTDARGRNSRKSKSSEDMIGKMEQFRPDWFGRRQIATATGPDGITGPHTNLFLKVRNRYDSTDFSQNLAIKNSGPKQD